jgi:hypothetical protein
MDVIYFYRPRVFNYLLLIRNIFTVYIVLALNFRFWLEFDFTMK